MCFLFGCFHCFQWLNFFISPTLFTMTAFLLLFIRYFVLCCCIASATDLRELFIILRRFFTLHSFPTFGTTCFYQDFPGSWQFFIEDCSTSHWGSKYRPSPSVCLDQTVFSKKVLVSRFYLCVKVLWNTISNFFRFSTHSLIVTYILKCMSYPLGHRSS